MVDKNDHPHFPDKEYKGSVIAHNHVTSTHGANYIQACMPMNLFYPCPIYLKFGLVLETSLTSG